MKKTTFLFIAILMANFNLFSADMSGNYTVGTTSGASYSTLYDAIGAINAATITGDITLLITSNITEPANFGLAKEFGTFKLTIRPDADADRIITFTQTTANVGPWGHFVIGYATENLGAAITEASLQYTNNVTIDGFAIGGSTRRLKFTTSAIAIANSTLTTIVGGCSNITIKNCIYDAKSTTATPRCINPFIVKNGAKDVAPFNILIDNNEIYSNPLSTINGTAIQCTATGSATAIIENLDITNNKIIASSTGIEIRFVNGVDITGNEIKMQKGTQTGGIFGIWLRGNTGNMNIIGNKFTETSTNQATSSPLLQTISISANASNPFNTNIFNNMFSGMDRKVTGATAVNQTYIGDAGYGTTKVYNNTFYLPTLTQPTQAGYYHAFKFTGSLKVADIQNNIFISNEDAKSVLISDPITSGTMNNNIYYLRAGNTNAKIIGTYTTLADFQTANPTLDINSKSVDVNFVDAAAGNLKLAGASIGNVDLATLRLPSVLTDFSNVNRAAITYRGADEASDLTPTAREYTVNVPNGTSKVFVAGSFPDKDWDITNPYQLTPTSTANQFWGIFPYTNTIAYKYLCEKNDWDYQEAAYNGSNPPVTGSNRAYSATDNVPIWYRVKSVKLNVSFATSAVPTQLFVKGGWDSWATPIELTKSGSTFSTTISGVLSDKIPANTQYKFYTNDMNTDNWESNADGSLKDNRWSIAPVMTDEIARFTTQIVTKLDNATNNARIICTVSGIEVQLNGLSTIELLNVNGVLIDKTISNSTYSRKLDNGIYILKINGLATKFIK